MTFHAETSAVPRWLFAEEGGEEALSTSASADKVTSSRLTLIETRRVVRRAEREGRITAAQCADLLAVFAQAVRSGPKRPAKSRAARRVRHAEMIRTMARERMNRPVWPQGRLGWRLFAEMGTTGWGEHARSKNRLLGRWAVGC